MEAALTELTEALGERAARVDPPPGLADADQIRRINLAEMAKCYYALERKGRDALSEHVRDAIDEGKEIRARDYLSALDWRQVLNAGLDELMTRCDAIICPAAPGPAPLLSEGTTGAPSMNGPWTLCGVPSLSLPLLSDNRPADGRAADRPPRRDARLLRVAHWLTDTLTSEAR